MHHTSSDLIFFEKLYTENYKMVYKHVTRTLRLYASTTADAADITQDVFSVAARHIDRLIVHKNPVGWLLCTAKYVCYSYLRKYARRSPEQLFASLDLHPCTDDEIAELDILISLEQVLSPQDYALVKAYCIDKQPAEAVCRKAGISPNLLRVRIHRIRKNLSTIFVLLVIFLRIHHI